MYTRMTIKYVLTACLCLSGLASGATLFYESYPDVNSLATPSAGSIQISGMNVTLALSGSTGFLFWSDGIGDGVAGPADGYGVIRSTARSSGTSPYAYLAYKLDAPVGKVISNPAAQCTIHTVGWAAWDVRLEVSRDGKLWEKLVAGESYGFGDTAVVACSQSGDPNYQGLKTVYYRVGMCTFWGNPSDWAAVVDDITVTGDISNSVGSVTLTVQKSPSGDSGLYTSPAVGTHTFSQGDIVDVNAVGYVQCPNIMGFAHWTGAVTNPASAATTVVMNTSKTITAVFVNAAQCGDVCHPYPGGDISHDCKVNFTDFAMVAAHWLECTQIGCGLY